MFAIIKKILKSPYCLKNKIISIEPNYKIINNLNDKSIVVDIGLGDNADFSKALIKKYNLRSFGFDPTRKHFLVLKEIEKRSNDHFKFYLLAISNKKGIKMFYESLENISGSLLKKHQNVKKDKVITYPVETITIEDIFSLIDSDFIDLLKMDIEGEEYAVLPSIKESIFKKIGQLVIEFHHHCIENISYNATLNCVKLMKNYGFREYSDDKINYLFFR